MPKTILFVDDERQILRALKRLFTGSDYDVILMESGADALDYLSGHPVNLIISDIRMPNMSGFDLLKKVKQKYPSVIRVALSGYTDSQAIYKALEENLIKIYLFKPWDNKELVDLISRLFYLEDLIKDKKLLDIINNIDDLPTLPHLFREITRMIAEDENVDRIAAVIEKDQTTAAKILRIANSAYFGAKTGSIAQAVMYIGLSNIKSIILSSEMFEYGGPFKKDIEVLWHVATLTNRFSQSIYIDLLKRKMPQLFASAGLLHNIGMVLLITQYGKAYEDVLQRCYRGEGDLVDIEAQILGITHQEIGGYLLNWWEMPLPIIEAALYHHRPLDERIVNKELVLVTTIANAMAWNKIGHRYYTMESDLRPLCETLGIDPDTMIRYFDTYIMEF